VYSGSNRYCLSYRGDPSTSVVVGWGGDTSLIAYDTVDHGQDYLLYEETRAPDRSISYKGQIRHFARLTGLTPNRVYYFVIFDKGGGISQRLKFQTLSDNPNDPVSFISGGDSRDGMQISGVYYEDCPSGSCRGKRQEGNQLVGLIRPDFVSFNGDMVLNLAPSAVDVEWSNWFDDWQLTISPDGKMYPLIVAQGNHEDNTDVYNLFDIPQEEYYTMNIHNGLMRLYSLNSEKDACLDTTQYNWLLNDLSLHTGGVNDPTWKVAQYHVPIFAMANNYGLEANEMQCWAPLFELYDVRLGLESHSHATKWTYPCVPNATFTDFVIDSLKGTVYLGEGQWGAPHRPLDFVGASQKPYVKEQILFDSFFFLKVTRDTIKIKNVQFANLGDIIPNTDDDLGSDLPIGTTIWSPASGDCLMIYERPAAPTTIVEDDSFAIGNIYPVPAKDIVSIEFQQVIKKGKIDVYNSLGKYCRSIQINEQTSINIDVSDLCSGVNYIYLTSESGKVESHRIVKLK